MTVAAALCTAFLFVFVQVHPEVITWGARIPASAAARAAAPVVLAPQRAPQPAPTPAPATPAAQAQEPAAQVQDEPPGLDLNRSWAEARCVVSAVLRAVADFTQAVVAQRSGQPFEVSRSPLAGNCVTIDR
jgi:hypothetical protein